MPVKYAIKMWAGLPDDARRMFLWDVVRGAAAGAAGTLQVTFALIVAIKFFDAGTVAKSIISGCYSGGLLLSLPYACYAPRFIRSKSLRGAVPALGCVAGLIVAATAHSTFIYTLGMVLFGLCAPLPLPTLTSLYCDSYESHQRGQLFGMAVIVSVLAGLLTQFVGGYALDADITYFRPLFLALALCSALMGYAVWRMPCGNAIEEVAPHPLRNLSLMRENPMFGYVLFTWFLFGAANLGLQPQRIEYLTQPEYGLQLSPNMVVLITGVTLEAARVCVIPVWAHLFDRFNFIWLRIWMCVFMAAHILLYYYCRSIPMLMLAMVLLGFAFGGGAIAWNLWVTKFAPPGESARYMAVHTFLTGTRGTFSPAIGYLVVQYMSIHVTAWISGAMVLIAIAMLWAIRDRPTQAGQTAP